MEQKKHSEINNPFIIVSLTDKASSSRNWCRGFCIGATILLLLIGISNFILLLFNVFLIVGIWYLYFKHTHKPKTKDDILQSNLKWFIRQHNLYKEDTAEVAIKENGTEKVKKEKYISYSAKFGIKTEPDKITIRAYKTGDCYTLKMNSFDIDLSALLNLSLTDKQDTISYCDYIFNKTRDKRLVITPSEPKYNDTDTIQLTSTISFRISKQPHLLLCGITGGGKTTFINYLLLEMKKMHSEIFVVDPKRSDLSSLRNLPSFGESHVASDPNNIARITREVTEIMTQRFIDYKENPDKFRYGANYIDYGLNSVWLVFDEVGAFRAEADKKVYAETMQNLTQIILKGREMGIFVILSTQQPNADNIPTQLRDNLSVRIALGNLSREAYRMVFGDMDLESIEAISEPGTGYIFIDGQKMNVPKYFQAPWLDYKDFSFLDEIAKYS